MGRENPLIYVKKLILDHITNFLGIVIRQPRGLVYVHCTCRSPRSVRGERRGNSKISVIVKGDQIKETQKVENERDNKKPRIGSVKRGEVCKRSYDCNRYTR